MNMDNNTRRLFSTTKRIANAQSFRRYLVVGFSTVFIDLLLLAILREHFGGGLFSAVTIAYWTSVAFNFLVNRNWSFGANKGMIPRQAAQYGSLLFFNYLVTITIVTLTERLSFSEYLGKIIALGVTIIWTYVIYKKVIFKNNNS